MCKQCGPPDESQRICWILRCVSTSDPIASPLKAHQRRQNQVQMPTQSHCDLAPASLCGSISPHAFPPSLPYVPVGTGCCSFWNSWLTISYPSSSMWFKVTELFDSSQLLPPRPGALRAPARYSCALPISTSPRPCGCFRTSP